MMEKSDKIYIAGHTGMVGSAIVRSLRDQGFENIVGKTIEELDLTNQKAVGDFFAQEKPVYVILAAAKVGGIHANNTYRAQFIYDNLMIQNNIIHNSYAHGVKKITFPGEFLYLSKKLSATDKGRILINRRTGTNQRTVCNCEDCRDQTMRELLQAVRL